MKAKLVKKKHTKLRKPLTKPKSKSLKKGTTPGQKTLRMKRPSLLTMVSSNKSSKIGLPHFKTSFSFWRATESAKNRKLELFDVF